MSHALADDGVTLHYGRVRSPSRRAGLVDPGARRRLARLAAATNPRSAAATAGSCSTTAASVVAASPSGRTTSSRWPPMPCRCSTPPASSRPTSSAPRWAGCDRADRGGALSRARALARAGVHTRVAPSAGDESCWKTGPRWRRRRHASVCVGEHALARRSASVATLLAAFGVLTPLAISAPSHSFVSQVNAILDMDDRCATYCTRSPYRRSCWSAAKTSSAASRCRGDRRTDPRLRARDRARRRARLHGRSVRRVQSPRDGVPGTGQCGAAERDALITPG